MGSVNIAIKKEAYDFLKALKGNSKSFSEVILGFKERERVKKGSKEAIMKYYGMLQKDNIDWEAKEERMRDFRREINERLGKKDK